MKLSQLTLLTFSLASSLHAQESIEIHGSESMGSKLVPQLVKVYQAMGNKQQFNIAAKSSADAFSNLLNGSASIGISSRQPNATESKSFATKGITLVQKVAATDMIAVVIHPKNEVTNLTTAQLKDIFTGKVTDWSALGGKAGKIGLLARQSDSGTSVSFRQLAAQGNPFSATLTQHASDFALTSALVRNVNSIGFISLPHATSNGAKAVSVNGVAPVSKNQSNYLLTRKLYYFTVSKPAKETTQFLNWCTTSAVAKKVIQKVGFIPVK